MGYVPLLYLDSEFESIFKTWWPARLQQRRSFVRGGGGGAGTRAQRSAWPSAHTQHTQPTDNHIWSFINSWGQWGQRREAVGPVGGGCGGANPHQIFTNLHTTRVTAARHRTGEGVCVWGGLFPCLFLRLRLWLPLQYCDVFFYSSFAIICL